MEDPGGVSEGGRRYHRPPGRASKGGPKSRQDGPRSRRHPRPPPYRPPLPMAPPPPTAWHPASAAAPAALRGAAPVGASLAESGLVSFSATETGPLRPPVARCGVPTRHKSFVCNTHFFPSQNLYYAILFRSEPA
jgi:hypothetical protein